MISILISLTVAVVAFFALVGAFAAGIGIGRKVNAKSDTELTDEQIKAIEKARMEQQNFLSYDGTPQ